MCGLQFVVQGRRGGERRCTGCTPAGTVPVVVVSGHSLLTSSYLPTLSITVLLSLPSPTQSKMVKLSEDMIVARTRVSDMNQVKKLNCWGAELSDIAVIRKLRNVEVLSLR